MKRFDARSRLALAVVLLIVSTNEPRAQCTVPATCGQWEGPFDLDVSCPVQIPCQVDEIVHAALIPSGVHKGDVLFWTRCHGDNRLPCTLEYKSHILDPQTMSAVAHPTFDTAYGPGVPDGPFCSGHAWMLDQDETPKLLVVGGVRIGTAYSSSETFWFDPDSTAIVPGSNPPETQYWFDGPEALPSLDGMLGGAWYPTVLTFLDPALDPPRFRPIAVGGTERPGGNCGDTYSGWWTMALPPAGSTTAPQWSTVSNPDGFKWPNYPRARLLHTDSGQGEIVTAGNDRVCVASLPCQKIVSTTNPQTHQEFVQAEGVGLWHENNAVLQHTLRPAWTWNTETPLEEYQLNRFIGLMGAENGQATTLGLVETRELTHGSILEPGPSTPLWVSKADAPVGRVFSNSVLLPDASVLVVGGQNNVVSGGNTLTTYYFTVDRFDPQNPLEAGTWMTLAESNPAGPGARTPRGYHSVALLLPDGSVVLMGGQNDTTGFGYPQSDDTLEVFRLPFFFNGSRPVLGNPGQTIHYAQSFLVNFTVAVGRQPERFCLIGVGSVTHSFDSGQRYVELMWRDPPPSGGSPGQATKYREVLPPPAPDMAPEGFYMLFGVDSAGVPSLGRFVKLTF